MATVDPVTPAILQYIDHGAYPDSETVASTALDTPSLTNLLQELRAAQDSVKNDIRTLSKSTAPDIDTWITRAKALQTDILHSRDTARAIVAEHESGKDLKAAVEDAGSKVRLLEKEVRFEEALAATLEQIRYANGVLNGVRDYAVQGDVVKALERLETAQESIDGLEGVKETRACGLLYDRVTQLRDDLAETAKGCWHDLIEVSQEGRSVVIKKESGKGEMTCIGLDALVAAAQKLEIFDDLVQKLSKDVERAVLRPRLMVNEVGHVAKITASDAKLSCSEMSEDVSHISLFHDLETIIDFFATHLPTSISGPISIHLIPALSTRLEEYWLEPAVPVDITEMPSFQDTLNSVQQLANHIDKCGWHGSKHLHDWVASAPRNWLTKRREAVLGDVRNLVFTGLRQTTVVERVETQMVSKDDHDALGGGVGAEVGDDEDWGTEWAEPEEEKVGDERQPVGAPLAGDEDGEDEGDAWGWGDGEEGETSRPDASHHQQPQQPVNVNGTAPAAAKPAERAITLRETFTVTAIPTGVLTILQTIISDAETLAGPAYSNAASTAGIAPAVARALYTLPTLALAIYRATAPTAYGGANAGNMLVYNDASHLSSLLREWQQSSTSTAQQLRLDGDVKALELFAKRAYSAEMDSQRTILHDLLSSTNGFANVNTPPFKAESESAVEQTVDRLREVHTQWKGVLSEGALLQSLGALLAGVMSKVISEVEELGDIGAEESHQLRILMDTISSVKDLFAKQGGDGGQDMTFVYCPNWLKFQYLAEILESSLVDIRFLWNEGELSLEFDAEEVVELIAGLFAESDLRRRAIAEIRRGGRR
ncbi:hypothetical protein LTR08_007927 [Meristemomyces frigidus]|nr:hypothetical protein LTR08_007927 [Meristemomyces frigidus]